MWDLVGNPEDQFSHKEALIIPSHIILTMSQLVLALANGLTAKRGAANIISTNFEVLSTTDSAFVYINAQQKASDKESDFEMSKQHSIYDKTYHELIMLHNFRIYNINCKTFNEPDHEKICFKHMQRAIVQISMSMHTLAWISIFAFCYIKSIKVAFLRFCSSILSIT